MLIKSADDHSKRLRLLEELRKSDRLDQRQKDWLREEYWRLAPGLAGERDAAHYLDMTLSHSSHQNHAVLHDLRLEADGQIAQIDHLIVDRMLTFYLLETKTYRGSLHINEQGEFIVEYSGERRYGIESPVEQSHRHEIVLKKVIKRLDIKGRAGTEPSFVHVVMVHPKGIIHRPPAKAFDTSMIIKADQFRTWYDKFTDNVGTASVIAGLVNIRGRDMIQSWGEKLAGEHRPSDPLWLPDFMKPKFLGAISVQSLAGNQAAAAAVKEAQVILPTAESNSVALLCDTCGKPLTVKAVQYCQNKAAIFGGKLYCFTHQKTAKALDRA